MTSPDPTVSFSLASIPPAAPVPVILPPSPAIIANGPVVVSPAQIWSATLQNIVIALCVTAAYFSGKLDQSIWLAALGYISGVDLFGRFKLPRSAAGALAVGSTGALSLLSKLPHVGTFLVALFTVLGLSGCATTLPEKTGTMLLKVESAYVRMDELYGAACLPEPVSPKIAPECVFADTALHVDALPAINAAVVEYNDVNALLKDDVDAGSP
jgi:hypothetical protein